MWGSSSRSLCTRTVNRSLTTSCAQRACLHCFLFDFLCNWKQNLRFIERKKSECSVSHVFLRPVLITSRASALVLPPSGSTVTAVFLLPEFFGFNRLVTVYFLEGLSERYDVLYHESVHLLPLCEEANRVARLRDWYTMRLEVKLSACFFMAGFAC